MGSRSGFDSRLELDELKNVIDKGSGAVSAATRQANAVANLGFTATLAQLNALGTAQANLTTFATNPLNANGMPSGGRVLLNEVTLPTGLPLAAAAGSGVFGLSITPATGENLISEAANSTTVTDVGIFYLTLPPTYKAASNFNIVVNQNYTIGSGTLTTKTLTVLAYRIVAGGTGTSNLGPAAGTLTATATDLTFAITGTTLLPGDLVLVKLSLVITETAGHNVTAQINSIRTS